MTVDKYLRLLAERAHDLLDHDPGGAYPRSVAASWAVAFDRLSLDDPTALDRPWWRGAARNRSR